MSYYLHGTVTGMAMLATTFAHALNSDAINTIAALPPATEILTRPEIAAPTPPATCRVKIVEYFSKENLAQINTELGEIKNWIKSRNYLNADIADYFHEDAYNNIMSYEVSYLAGTETGEVFLQDPVLALGAMFAYTDFAEELKAVMYEIGHTASLFEFSNKFDGTMQRIRGIALTTEDLLDKQMASSCLSLNPRP